MAGLALSPLQVPLDHALSPEQSQVWAENPVPPRYALEEAPQEPESAPETLEMKIMGGDTSTTTLRAYIEEQAELVGVSPLLATAIVKAESGFVWNAKNPASSASGAWQFINQTFKDYCITKYQLATSTLQKNDVITQTKCALAILKEPQGERHWNSSYLGWKQYKPYGK